MAWRTGDGGSQFRKDSSAAKRSETERAALVESITGHRRKSMPNYKKKFGIERRYIGEDQPGLRFLRRREWHMNYGRWYEKERDRDNALIALRRNGMGSYRKDWEYRPVDR